MSGLSTTQVRVLAQICESNDQGRGSSKPKGPSGRPFGTLLLNGLIELRTDGNYYPTEAGRRASEHHSRGKPTTDGE